MTFYLWDEWASAEVWCAFSVIFTLPARRNGTSGALPPRLQYILVVWFLGAGITVQCCGSWSCFHIVSFLTVVNIINVVRLFAECFRDFFSLSMHMQWLCFYRLKSKLIETVFKVQILPQREHDTSPLQVHWIWVSCAASVKVAGFEIIIVFSENHTKPINIVCVQTAVTYC